MRGKSMALVACLLVSGCGQENGQKVQAGSTLTAGPAAVATPTAGPGIPTPTVAATTTTTTTAPPPSDGPIRTIDKFETLITNAIYYKQRKGDPAVTIQRRKYAQYQFIVSWHVSSVAGDPLAEKLSRYDGTRILKFIQKADLPTYGSVLLLATAKIKDTKNGATIVTQVVRAKYSANAVKNSTFTTANVWKLTDDKAATVHPDFK